MGQAKQRGSKAQRIERAMARRFEDEHAAQQQRQLELAAAQEAAAKRNAEREAKGLEPVQRPRHKRLSTQLRIAAVAAMSINSLK